MRTRFERGSGGTIEERFIEVSLRQTAADIMKDYRKKTAGFRQERWNQVSMNVAGNTLTYTHLGVNRFLDMKRRKTSSTAAAEKKNRGKKKRSSTGGTKKRFQQIHNKIIYSHKVVLNKQLRYGFTEEVKQQFRDLEDSGKKY